MATGSVSKLISRATHGDAAAGHELLARYFRRLLGLYDRAQFRCTAPRGLPPWTDERQPVAISRNRWPPRGLSPRGHDWQPGLQSSPHGDKPRGGGSRVTDPNWPSIIDPRGQAPWCRHYSQIAHGHPAYRSAAIAAKFGCTSRTLERKASLIGTICGEEEAP